MPRSWISSNHLKKTLTVPGPCHWRGVTYLFGAIFLVANDASKTIRVVRIPNEFSDVRCKPISTAFTAFCFNQNSLSEKIIRLGDALNELANTRSPEAPAAADIHLHVSPWTPSQRLCVHARLYVSHPLLSDECPPTCSTDSRAGCVPSMAITSIANIFSVTFCR